MAIQYTTTISSLKVFTEYQGYSDVVYALDWVYTGTDGTFTMNVTGTTPISVDLGAQVTPYADISESTAMSWLLTTTNPEVWSDAQAQISAWITEQYAQNGTVLSPPWLEA